MQTVTIGFLGCGNIGTGVYRLLTGFARDIAHREGVIIHVKRMLVRDIQKARPSDIPIDRLTDDPCDILRDPEITLVAEFMGGEQPATEYMLRALRAGKTVVTANKMAMALNWHLLQKAAQESGVGLYYEASVCGAIPIIRTLTDSLQANRIERMMGIINGTTNYILTRMSQNGSNYEDVLADAQRLGLAEPDPTSDVEGFDAVYKLSILASLAFHARVPAGCVYREGITRVTSEDIAFGQHMGYTLKLLAIAKRHDMTVDVRVHPAFIRSTHPMASVSGAFNAIHLCGHACGDMMLYGHGAGDAPTASAVVSDILYALKRSEPLYPTFVNKADPSPDLSFTDDWSCGFFVRLSAIDEPGVLGNLTANFGRYGVSIATMVQKEAREDGHVPITFITHSAHEKALHAALAEIDSRLARVESVIRVEE